MRMSLWIMVSVLVLGLATGPVHAGDVVGYRGDGTCLGSGSPPASFDEKAGTNIAWRTVMPSWCLGSPVVANGRVFVMSEPPAEAYWPVLLCLDAGSGKELWRREIDAIAMMEIPDEDKRVGRAAWEKFMDLDRLLYTQAYHYRTAEDKDAALAELKRHGLKYPGKGPRSVGCEDGKEPFQIAKVFNRINLYFDVWHWSGMSRIGYAFPTPVADEKRVWVATGSHAFACFDHEGNVVWQKFVPGQYSSNRGYGGTDFCKNARSPLVYKDLFISDVGAKVRAFDKATGELKWSHEHYTKHQEITSPVVITVSDQEVLLSWGPKAYRLPDGKPLEVEGWSNPGATMLVRHDQRDTVFFTGGGEHGGWEGKGNSEQPPPAAVKFSLHGDVLKAKVLWSGVKGEAVRRHTGIVYDDGKLYHPHGFVIDADTGKVVAGSTERRRRGRGEYATPETRHFTWIADGRLYGIEQRKPKRGEAGRPFGVVEVYDQATGKPLGSSVLTTPKRSAKKQAHIIATCGTEDWGFSFGSPFVVEDGRLYVRSNDELICIARPGE